jgi:hypothetical protein
MPGRLADILRYGAWYAFVLLVLLPSDCREPSGGQGGFKLGGGGHCSSWWWPASCAGLAGQWRGAGRAQMVLFVTLALPVIAMVLLEQLFRNVAEDSRWNIKPLCLGLAGAFLFDLYLYSEAVLFGARRDALGIRGRGACAGGAASCCCRRRASRDWLSKIRISRKVAFHSATLMIAGFYLLFVSAVGYYVRYFGGEWGRALQLGWCSWRWWC